jgi:3-oxoacyl-[acyl-carrier protein] reductase
MKRRRRDTRTTLSMTDSSNHRKHDGRVAVVTGGNRGIGRAIAARLAAEGARVAITGRNREQLSRSAKELCVRAWPLDIREEQSCRRVLSEIAKELGPIDLFVANAGIGGSNEAGPADRWREVVATNLDGTYFSVRAAIENMNFTEDGSPAPRRDIIIVSSVLAKFGVPGYTAYCASKSGLLGLVRALALELAPRRVMVNAVCPGWVETDMALDGLRGMADAMNVTVDQARARAMEAVPLCAMSSPEHVAALVSWIASAECVGMTGQSIHLNQGSFME